MALQESYTTGDDIQGTIVGTNWYGQTWTTTSAYNITSVRVKLYRPEPPPTNFIVSIRATSGDLPTGGDLTSGSIAGSGITVGSPGAFIDVPVTPYALSDATVYAICCRVDSISCSWRVDNSSPSYGGGRGVSSTNSGSSWSGGSWDSMFEIHGSSGSFSELSGTIAAASTVSGNLDVSVFSALSGTIAAVTTVGPASLGSLVVGMDVKTATIKRMVAAGNNQFWYESI